MTGRRAAGEQKKNGDPRPSSAQPSPSWTLLKFRSGTVVWYPSTHGARLTVSPRITDSTMPHNPHKHTLDSYVRRPSVHPAVVSIMLFHCTLYTQVHTRNMNAAVQSYRASARRRDTEAFAASHPVAVWQSMSIGQDVESMGVVSGTGARVGSGAWSAPTVLLQTERRAHWEPNLVRLHVQ